MASRMLLVGDNVSSFILNAIRDGLKGIGFEVDSVQPKLNELNNLKAKPTHVLIYAGEFVDSATDAIVFLKDYCLENDIAVSLVGYLEEIETLKKIIPGEIINYVFERPLNVKELVEKMSEEGEKQARDELKKHILVVDDSGTMLRTIKSWLSVDYRVSIASSAAMAITFLASNKPDLILLDYEMPVCNGPQFLEMIRQETATKDIPVIFLTAKGDRESVQSVLSLKPAGYLLKTMSPGDVQKYINEFFDKRKNI